MTTENTELAKGQANEQSLAPTKEDKLISESTPEGKAFALLQRKAVALSVSDFMPKEFQGNVAKCLIAIELSERIGATPIAVAQNMYEVYGKPSWSSSFVISAINSSGKFPRGLRFVKTGEHGTPERTCYAYAIDEDGERVEGPPTSLQMAKEEGWLGKKGSKWITMPELMLMYRAATFFGRLYSPEIMNGMQTSEEIYDIGRGGHEIRRVESTDENPFKPAEKVVEAAEEKAPAKELELTPAQQDKADYEASIKEESK